MNERLDEIILKDCASAPAELCFWWRGTWWSRSALEEMAAECAANLARSGFTAGQRLGLVMPNCPLMLASCIAAWKLGGAVVPVNPHLKHPSVPEYLSCWEGKNILPPYRRSNSSFTAAARSCRASPNASGKCSA